MDYSAVRWSGGSVVHDIRRLRTVDVVEQRINGGASACFVGLCPAFSAQSLADLLFSPFSEFPHGLVNRRGSGLLGHSVASTENARCPGVAPFQCRGCGKWRECVDERELVVKRATAHET